MNQRRPNFRTLDLNLLKVFDVVMVERNVTRERDYFDITLSGMVPMPNARFSTSSLVAPVTSTQTIVADPTNGDPYDAGSNTFLRLIQVPATDPRSFS